MSAKPSRKTQVDFSVWYHTLHAYIQLVEKEETREKQNKESQLRAMGQKLGKNFIEIISSEESLEKLNKNPQGKHTEYIRYICKEFWQHLFGKIMPKVQLSSTGIFYLTDNDFQLLDRISCLNEKDKKGYVDMWRAFLSGLLEGTLLSFDIISKINAEITSPVRVEIQQPGFHKEIIEDYFRSEVVFSIQILN